MASMYYQLAILNSREALIVLNTLVLNALSFLSYLYQRGNGAISCTYIAIMCPLTPSCDEGMPQCNLSLSLIRQSVPAIAVGSRAHLQDEAVANVRIASCGVIVSSSVVHRTSQRVVCHENTGFSI